MPGEGTIFDEDPSELVELVERNLRRGGLRSLLRRIDAVTIHPASGDPGRQPSAQIGLPGMFQRTPRVVVAAPDIEPRMVRHRLAEAGVAGGEPKMSWGILAYAFPPGVTSAELVDFCLGALRALGALSADGWAYEGEEMHGE